MIVEWSAKRKLRLREIHDCIAADSSSAAIATVDRLTTRSARLVLIPRIDRRVPEYPEAELREVLERP